jgi:hypothetical protein
MPDRPTPPFHLNFLVMVDVPIVVSNRHLPNRSESEVRRSIELPMSIVRRYSSVQGVTLARQTSYSVHLSAGELHSTWSTSSAGLRNCRVSKNHFSFIFMYLTPCIMFHIANAMISNSHFPYKSLSGHPELNHNGSNKPFHTLPHNLLPPFYPNPVHSPSPYCCT